jgi:phage/plasmid-associated DNA primase
LQLKRPTTTSNSLAQPVRTTPAATSTVVKHFPRAAQPSVKVPPVTQIAIAPIPTDRVLNTRAAAKILGETHEVLKKWRQRDQGPEYVHFPNGHIRYRLSVLKKFIEDHTVRPEFPVAWEVEEGALLNRDRQESKRLA